MEQRSLTRMFPVVSCASAPSPTRCVRACGGSSFCYRWPAPALRGWRASSVPPGARSVATA
eukprot:6187865-Pleurochrysis_carterae.AAC.1